MSRRQPDSVSLNPTKFRITLEYDGTNYSGWQLQNGQDSIQAQLEAALAQLFGGPIRVYAAGRTDAGVHALGQVAAFQAPTAFDPDDLRRALNAILPRDIAVRAAAVSNPSFDPRREAILRIYEYRVLNRSVRSVFEFRYAWQVRERLEFGAMRSAAREFLGEHDFAALRTAGSEERTTIRRIEESEWRREGDLLIYRVAGTAFLRHMVRTMVSLMIAVGAGRLPLGEIGPILESRDRARAPAAAPPCGLFLMEIRY